MLFNAAKILFIAFAWLIFSVFIIGLAVPATWIGELCISLLPYQILLSLVVGVTVYLCQRDIEWYCMILVCFLGLFTVLYTYVTLPSQPTLKQQDVATLAFTTANLGLNNIAGNDVTNYFKKHKADLAAVYDMSKKMQADITASQLFDQQIASKNIGRDSGMLGLANTKGVEWQMYGLGETKRAMFKAVVPVGQHQLTLFFVNLSKPSSEALFHERNKQLAQLTTLVRETKGPRVVLGNFKMSPYSYYYGQFLEDTALRPLKGQHWFRSTWFDPELGLGLSLDHVFMSKEVALLYATIGPHIGSAYLPINARVYISTAAQSDLPSS